MNIYYLYVKTHRITGLQYLGYTAKPDPYSYHGSGSRWNLHLKKHGYNLDTKILHRCVSKSAIKSWGMFYSKLWSVVDSNKWANLKEESGDGGGCFGKVNGMFNKTHTDQVKNKLGQEASKRFKDKSYIDLYGEEKAAKLKKLRSDSAKGKDNSFQKNSRFDNTHYTFFNIKTGEILNCTRWTLMKYYGVNKSVMCDVIYKGATGKDWCVLYN